MYTSSDSFSVMSVLVNGMYFVTYFSFYFAYLSDSFNLLFCFFHVLNKFASTHLHSSSITSK